MEYFRVRRDQAREFAFFKIYSSLGKCNSIENLQHLNVLDNDEIAFTEPGSSQYDHLHLHCQSEFRDRFCHNPRLRFDRARAALEMSPIDEKGGRHEVGRAEMFPVS